MPCALDGAAESCWASHTGVQGATGYTEAQIESGQGGFTHVTGDITISTAGTVISHEWISGCIAVDANNVTIEDSLITTQDQCHGGNQNSLGSPINDGNGTTPTGLLIEDTTVDAQNANSDNGGISIVNGECLRCNSFGATHAYTLTGNDTLQDSYGHDLTSSAPGAHEETVNLDTADNVTITDSYLRASGGNGYITGSVFYGNSYGSASGLNLTGSYLEGDNGADIAVGCSNTDVQITNDALSSDSSSYGYYAGPGSFSWTATGNGWSNNYDSQNSSSISPISGGCS